MDSKKRLAKKSPRANTTIKLSSAEGHKIAKFFRTAPVKFKEVAEQIVDTGTPQQRYDAIREMFALSVGFAERAAYLDARDRGRNHLIAVREMNQLRKKLRRLFGFAVTPDLSI